MKLIHLLFGKPYKKHNDFKSMYFRGLYWFVVCFYFISISMLLVSSFFDPIAIIGLLMSLVFFPLAFRLIYSVLGKFNGMERVEG
ncbi:hypothetical protein JOC95_000453 [Bacillus tianshenii]|uniref:Uncharacterized protein n=1 Tax=Sutcliffiella tianshenii TaxID=1463404 RepID=A0ABS2NVC2_9BACI|nr:hypothetical protein [Bacillus tianshenii]MBM7618611.1 hypothetical protein [Bacillus tianshenii]